MKWRDTYNTILFNASYLFIKINNIYMNYAFFMREKRTLFKNLH